jgi:hypothetical protein
LSERRFSAGEVIVERTVWNGLVLTARPLTAISDEDGLLVASVSIGTRWFGPIFANREAALDEVRDGTMGWGERVWEQHNLLLLVRPGDPYSVYGFWNEEGAFVAWYINLQEPMRRTRFGFDTRDQLLDIIVGEDLSSWMWKDTHELKPAIELGLHTAEEVAQIRSNGERVIELVEHGEVWWADWRGWEPQIPAQLPTLPEGWDQP